MRIAAALLLLYLLRPDTALACRACADAVAQVYLPTLPHIARLMMA